MRIPIYLHKLLILGGIALTGIAVAIGCSMVHSAVNQMAETVRVEKEAGALDEGDEDQLGQSVAIYVTSEYKPSEDPRLIRYVNMVGFTLVNASPKPDRHYVFGVLESDDIGAFSGPNGYVMITTGALKSMRDEAELAGVLAHELTHVIEQHGLQAAKTEARKAGYLNAANNILQTDAIGKFVGAGVDAITHNGYDKRQEAAADAGAVDLLIAAGYDPHAYANYLAHLSAMQQMQPQTRPGEVAAAVQKIMATHPGIADRYKVVMDKIAESNNIGGARLKARFRSYVPQ